MSHYQQEEHGVALIGGGIFARTAHLPALAQTPTLKLKAVYSRTSTSATSIASACLLHPATAHNVDLYFDVPGADGSADSRGQGDLHTLLLRSDIKTVILSLPIGIQGSVIERCWESGKNVISEKPIAKDLKEAKRLIGLWETRYRPMGLKWIVGEQFPYEPSLVKAKELMQHIGVLRSFSMEYYSCVQEGTPYLETVWRKNPTHQGGFLLDGGVHWASGLRYLLPTSMTSLTASRSLNKPYLAPFDTLSGLLLTSSPSVHGSFFLTFAQEGTPSRGYFFKGSLGKLTIDMSSNKQVVTLSPDNLAEVKFEFEGRAVKEEFLKFGEALVYGGDRLTDVENRSGPKATIKDLEFIEKALESGGDGEWKDLFE